MASEKAFLVGIQKHDESRAEALQSLQELRQLVYTAGARVVQESFQALKQIHSKYFIGEGKAQEILERIQAYPVDLIIFDHDLTPAQQGHLEALMKTKIVDRTGLILDIFARRARSREGKLQVELAQLHYLLPRLKGHGVMLSRLGGGIGTRGPGEAKLEIDRRRIRDRIVRLNREIKLLEKTRGMHRKKRQQVPVPIAALVGYTNSGKSTLLNHLTKSDVLVEDKLFATLDPTTRQLFLPNKQKILVTDTVGFIKKLPVELVKAFKATLEEVVEADLLLHVIDLSHPEFETQAQEVIKTLESLGVSQKPVLYVYNKVDISSDPRMLFLRYQRQHPFSIISAQKEINLNELLEKVQNMLSGFVETITVKIPLEDQRVLSQIYADGFIIDKKYFKKSIRIKAKVSHRMASQLKKRYVG